jgi:hypothetical protein
MMIEIDWADAVVRAVTEWSRQCNSEAESFKAPVFDGK